MDDGRPNFGKLQTRMHVSDPATARKLKLSTPTIDFVFDLLAFDGSICARCLWKHARRFFISSCAARGLIRYCDSCRRRGKDFFQGRRASGSRRNHREAARIEISRTSAERRLA